MVFMCVSRTVLSFHLSLEGWQNSGQVTILVGLWGETKEEV